MKFEESTLIADFITECKSFNFIVTPQLAIEFAMNITKGVTDFLFQTKTKDGKVALKFCDLKGNFIIAGIVSYDEGDNEIPGAWNYVWSFDQKDIEDCLTTYSITDTGVKQAISTSSYDRDTMIFTSVDFISQLSITFFSMLRDFLDANAKEGEVFELELDGYFVASVEVENDERIKSFVPDGAMKRLIKDDDAASEAVA